MAEVLSPPATSSSPSPHQSQLADDNADSIPSLPQPRERNSSYAQSRTSQLSRSSQRSRPQSSVAEYPAFPSSLAYAFVRDFAYPVFHPLHYGAELEPSSASTPGSDWNSGRRQSDPMEQWNGGTGGWSAGPWGGDGMMYGDPEHDSDLASLPSTSFSSEEGAGGLEFGDDELVFKKGKHRKSKSYANISDYERGRRRESNGRRNRNNTVDDQGMFFFQGQQSDPAGRDSLRLSRGHSDRRDSGRAGATLPNRSFHHGHTNNDDIDPDEHIPLDIEPRRSSPVRDSMGPEDEELFAGPSLALYSFEPENSNELRLYEGQEIMVSYRHGQGWLVASDPRTGEQGLVPEAYVRLIADMPNYDPETGQFVDLDEDEEDESEEVQTQTQTQQSGMINSREVGRDGEEEDEDEEEDEESAADQVPAGKEMMDEDEPETPVELAAKRLEGEK